MKVNILFSSIKLNFNFVFF